MEYILTPDQQNCIRRSMGMDERDDLENIDLSYLLDSTSSNRGDHNPFYGCKHTCTSKNLMSKKKIGMFQAKDTNGNAVGLVHRDDPRIKSGEYIHINKGMKHSEKFKQDRSIEWKKRGIKPPSSKGMLWWNDGNTCKRSLSCPGIEWKRGRL